MISNKAKQLDLLSSVVHGTADARDQDVSALLGDREISRIGRFLSETKDIEPDKRYLMFHNEDFLVNDHTKDTYYDILESLHPSGRKVAKKSLRDRVHKEITSFTSDEEREGYLRDNIKRFPNDMLPELERYFFSNQDKINSKTQQTARASQVIEFEKTINRHRSSVPDPNKSLEVHVQEFLKAYSVDMGDGIEFTEGVVTIPGPAGDRVSTLNLPKNTDILDEFILQMDLAPMAREVLKPALLRSRDKAKKAERKANESMFKNLNRFPDDIKTNVILDYGLDQREKAPDAIRLGISNIVSKKIQEGKVQTIKDILSYYKIERNRIMDALSERVADGRER